MNKVSYLGICILPMLLPQQSTAKVNAPTNKGEMQKPNIIFILADDMGYGDVSAFNEHSLIQTVNIDRMAANGVSFRDAHSSSSVSTPTRYGVLTGRYNWRTKLKQSVLDGFSTPLISTERSTMASMLKANGYTTACIGKWHLGWNWGLKPNGVPDSNAPFSVKSKDVDFTKPIDGGPTSLGFDYFYGFCGSLDMPPYVYIEQDRVTTTLIGKVKGGAHPGFWRAGDVAKDFTHQDCLPNITRKAVKYIKEQEKKEKPFFLYLPLPAPHTPILPSENFKGKSGIGAYGDFVLMVDDVVGQIREALTTSNLDQNTIIVFTTDNGCSPSARITELEERGHSPNYIWRGMKADLFEGGHRVPTIVEWKKASQGGVCDQIICLNDFYATFAALNNHKLKDNEAEDSYNILPLLKNPNQKKNIRKAIVHHSFLGEFAIRKGEWKLLCTPSSGGWSFPKPGVNDKEIAELPEMQLYNLKDDPSETKNLFEQNPKIAEKMKALLVKYIKEGRSTAGKKQANDSAKEWIQIERIMQ